jgi:hypothetical protein
MPFVQRRLGIVCGCYAALQPSIAEEFLPDNAPEILAFLNPTPDPRTVLDEQERAAAKVDNALMALVNSTPAQLQTFAQNNFPSLTVTERNRMAVILNILAVAVRPHVRS